MADGLSTRKQRILHAVVSDYVSTGEPVGSEWLATRHDFGCRSATLRNEMGEMVEAGFLVQPHTSSGRIPTTVGYRYYVDRLMTPDPPERPKRLAARRRLETAADDVRNTVRDACRALAELTQYASVASAPTDGDIALHRLYLARAGSHHVLLVLLLTSGHVENRIVDVGCVLDERAVNALADSLNAHLAGTPVRDLVGLGGADLRPRGEKPRLQGEDDGAGRRVRSAVSQTAASFADEQVYFEGAGYMLRQQEFRDLLRLEQLLAALMDQRALLRALRRMDDGVGVTVLIGPESRMDSMDDCSLVTTRYHAGAAGWGYIGVVGPTRMRYDRAVAAVDLMARGLSAALARARPDLDAIDPPGPPDG
jgi:heat-inducible transcriptional repressor